jgi:hypothetical protein
MHARQNITSTYFIPIKSVKNTSEKFEKMFFCCGTSFMIYTPIVHAQEPMKFFSLLMNCCINSNILGKLKQQPAILRAPWPSTYRKTTGPPKQDI